MWFHSWSSIVRILVLGSLGYVALIVLLRVSGKRTLSKMNAFDFVVTITLGSAFASLLLTKSVTLADGVTALGLLIGLQFVVSWLSVRSRRIQSLVKSSPQLVFWRGRWMDAALKRERVTRDEVEASMRKSGVTDVGEAAAVLETDGTVTVLDLTTSGEPYPLAEVRDVPREATEH